MKNNVISVIGGSGFLGSYIVNELLKNDYVVQVISRSPKDSEYLKTSGKVGNLIFTKCDIRDYEALKLALSNSSAVINAVGILFEGKNQTFTKIHHEGAKNVARAAVANKITKLIHISALNVNKSSNSAYAKTKLAGENEILSIFPLANIIRPGLIFGYEDNFFNQFAQMANLSFFLPLIGGGKTKFQPVCVLDIAKSVALLLECKNDKAKIYEFAGPKIYSFKELLEFILSSIGKKRILLPIPFFAAKIMAVLLNILPCNIISLDQVRLLEYDNVIETEKDILTFKDLKIAPIAIEDFVPKYLQRYK